MRCLHWFAVTGLFEYLGRHVAWRAAGCGQDVELLFVHYSRKTEVGYQQVGIVFWCAEEEVFGLEIPMHDPMVVQVGYGRESCSNQIGGV